MDALRHVIRRVESRVRNAQRVEHVFGDPATLGLPRVALAELSAMTDQHQQWNAIELRAGHDAVHRREKSVVLHQHRRLHSGEVRARRDADALLFFGESNERHFRIVLGHSNQMHEPRFGERRDDAHSDVFERLVDQFGAGN